IHASGSITAANYFTRGTATLKQITAQTISTSYLNTTLGITSSTLTTNKTAMNGTILYSKKD
ncbi:MAG: hypothetical protein ACKPKO_16995, partial [Candidatus Fonsibacter sp.]